MTDLKHLLHNFFKHAPTPKNDKKFSGDSWRRGGSRCLLPGFPCRNFGQNAHVQLSHMARRVLFPGTSCEDELCFRGYSITKGVLLARCAAAGNATSQTYVDLFFFFLPGHSHAYIFAHCYPRSPQLAVQTSLRSPLSFVYTHALSAPPHTLPTLQPPPHSLTHSLPHSLPPLSPPTLSFSQTLSHMLTLSSAPKDQ